MTRATDAEPAETRRVPRRTARSRWLGRDAARAHGRLLFRLVGRLALHARARRARHGRREPGAGARPARRRSARAGRRRGRRSRRYARYWFDSFHVVGLVRRASLERFECVGIEHLQEALAAGTGVIMALPHIGNWDVAGRVADARGVARRGGGRAAASHRELFDLFVGTAKPLGMRGHRPVATRRRRAAARAGARGRTASSRWSPTAISPAVASRSRCSAARVGCPPARRCSRSSTGAPLVVAPRLPDARTGGAA